MGAYSEMDLDMQFDSDNPFISDSEVPVPMQAGSQDTQASAPAAPTRPQPPQTDDTKKKAADDAAAKHAAEEDEKRRAHEESEAKRKAEWEARQQAKKAAEQEQLDKLAAMSDDEVMMASTRRIGADTERLTRRNMKECISEHIQTLCLEDPAYSDFMPGGPRFCTKGPAPPENHDPLYLVYQPQSQGVCGAGDERQRL